jgi:hypothetical protein
MSDASPLADQRPVRLDDKTKSIMDRAIAREQSLSRILMTYIVTGLVFMLLPGTFLGVWNLLKISNREAAESIAPAWIQAHGHAQLFGWVGTFILGIGFYSIPKLRKLKPFALWEGWLCWALWVVGVTTRWLSDIYPWQWRILMPMSAVLEVLAFLIFFQAVASHRPSNGVSKPWESWIFVVIAATLGLLASLALNLGASIQLALYGSSPAFPHVPCLARRPWRSRRGLAARHHIEFARRKGSLRVVIRERIILRASGGGLRRRRGHHELDSCGIDGVCRGVVASLTDCCS